MQPKNLGWKFAFVAIVIILSVLSIWAYGLRQGIDLKGGHILIFEIRSRGREIPNLVEKVIARLKERVDPTGTSALEWRPIGRDRFEVRMPLGSEEARRAKQEYLDALDRLEQGNIRRSELSRVITLTGQARAKLIEQISRGDKKRIEALWKVAKTHDALLAAREALKRLKLSGQASIDEIKKAQARCDDAEDAYDEAVHQLFALNVNIKELGNILRLYLPKREAKVLPAKKVKAKRQAYRKQLDRLRKQHPERWNEIQAVVSAYEKWTELRTGLDDPADLKRIFAHAGVLDFRIAPTLPGSAFAPAISQALLQKYLNELAEYGPLVGRARNEPYLWFPIHEGCEKLSPNLVIGRYAGRKYLLLYNQEGFMMTHEPGKKPWALKEAYPTTDNLGRPAVGFTLDTRGAKLMGTMTATHKKQFMAILLDNEVYSAPIIEDVIYDRGIIRGDFTPKEVDELVRILNAGVLEGTVNPNPVSEKTVGPSMGKDNREAGVRAAIWAFIAVAVFMIFYYLGAGAIANVALLLNLVLVLGAMSFIQAVFTLPGIAGIVLTIGMAVDANVLIFERLREEQKKTQSIRMAIKNAYSNAARAIIDSNVTTLVTCIILGLVATEEIRGFALTLGFGIVFSMFTSLLVTRWIFELLIEIGVIKKRVPTLAFIGVPAIEWMRKRRTFLMGSAILITVGLIAVFNQGKDLLGIDFSSGTRAVFKFKQGVMIPGEDNSTAPRMRIEQALKREAEKLEKQTKDPAQRKKLKKLAASLKVETLIDRHKADEAIDTFDTNADRTITLQEWVSKGGQKALFKRIDKNGDGKLTRAELITGLPERNYQVSTTVADITLLRKIVMDTFGDALEMHRSINFKRVSPEIISPALSADIESEGKPLATYITVKVAQQVPADLRAKFLDAVGGVMFVIDVNPTITEKELAQRIQTMRLQPDFAEYQFNRTTVIGLKADPSGRGFKTLAVLVRDPANDFAGQPEQLKKFAASEWYLLSEALKRTESLESVTQFDPAIASQTQSRAIIAFVISWLAIILYLWVRFGSWRWGTAAVLCLIHDVIISVGLVGLAAFISHTPIGKLLLIQPFKIDMVVVSAFLTIVGYSVNDTIVVFDRIRENRGKLTKINEPIINRSINQTLSRTLLTSATTLIAVVIMYIWGGAGIHAFTYALLVGIIIGTYSSIGIASPMLLGFKEMLVKKVIRAGKVNKITKAP